MDQVLDRTEYDDNYSYYRAYKEEIMDEDELIVSGEIMNWYRSSWYDKEHRGMFERWQNAEVYWEGDANQAYYEDDPASNTNIVHPNIETLVSMTVDKNMGINVTARTPAEQEYVTPITTMMEFIKEKNKTVMKAYNFTRRLYKFGTGIFRVLYNPEIIDEFGLPEIRTVNPAYLFVDPNVVEVYDIQSGKFIIETKYRSIHSAREEFGDVADAIFPNYDLIEDAEFFGEDESGAYNDEGRQHYIHFYVFFRDLVPIDDEDDEDYAEMEDGGYYAYDVKLRMIEMSADGVILRDTYKEEDAPYFPDEEFPYFLRNNYEREGTIWGKSDLSNLVDLQDQLNDLDDQIRSNTRLFGNPQKWADPTSGLELDMWTNERGLILPVVGGKDKIGYLQINPVSQDVINRRDRIVDVDTTKTTRVNPQMSGQRQKGVDSATEALSLRESSNTVVDPKVYVLEDVLSDVFTYCFKLAVYYWDEERFFPIIGTSDFLSFNPSKMANIPDMIPADDEYLEGFRDKETNKGKKEPKFMLSFDSDGETINKFAEVSISIKIGTGTSKNKAFTYSVMKDSASAGLVSKGTMLEYLRDHIDVPIPEKEISQAKELDDLKHQLTVAQMKAQIVQANMMANPQPQGQPGLPAPGGGAMSPPEGSDLIPGMANETSPQRPQSPMRGQVTSIANNT